VRPIVESLENMNKPAPTGLTVCSDEDVIDVWRKDVWHTQEFVENLFVENNLCFNTGSFDFESGCPMIGGEDFGLQRVYEYISEKKLGNLTNQKN